MKNELILMCVLVVILANVSCSDPSSRNYVEYVDKPIFFASSDYGLSRMASDGVVVERIIPKAYHPQVSPDKTKIVYHKWDAGDNEIWLANIDGSNIIQLTDHDSKDFDPCFSPDGSKILFVTDRNGNEDLYTIDLYGNNLTQITSSIYNECFSEYSPDGTKITYTHQQGTYSTIVVCDSDGQNPVDLIQDPSFTTWAWGGHWSPDGTKVLYTIWNGNGMGLHTLNSVDADGTNKQLVYDVIDCRDGSYSPDGSIIVFESKINGDWQIFSIHSDGTRLSQLTNELNDCYHPNWIR